MNLETKWLGLMPYCEAHDLQLKLREERRAGVIGDTLLLLEHPPTFTMGRRDCGEDFLVPPDSLTGSGFEIIKVERGGKITYHGPGQLVGYLICDLRARRLSVPDFVGRVEQGLRVCLQELGVIAQLKRGCPGLWVKGRKIASVGFHIDRGISMHGFALNVSCDLSPFGYIIPCGHSCEMSSLEQETGKLITPESLTYSVNLHMKEALWQGGSCQQNSDGVPTAGCKEFRDLIR